MCSVCIEGGNAWGEGRIGEGRIGGSNMDDVQVLDIDGERSGKNISMGKGTLMGREKQLVS